jgi:hypothetical protein
VSRVVSKERWGRYADARLDGAGRTEAARKFGISYAAAVRFDRGDERSSGFRVWFEKCRGRKPFRDIELTYDETVPANTPAVQARIQAKHQGDLYPSVLFDPRNAKAKAALDDFELFRRRYFGHVSLPWHVEAATRLLHEYTTALDEGGRRYVLLNVAPGAGKTTLLHDFAAWVTTRNRAVRGSNCSRAETLATRNTARLKRSFERLTPALAKPGDKSRGMACDAEATLAQDFGPFKPDTRTDLWTRDSFIVLQQDGSAIAEKEPTWSSYGLDSAILGNRFDLMLCDDLVDKGNIRTETGRQDAMDVFGDEIEKRLDDAGLLVVAGQRMHRRDMYRWLRDLPVEEWDDLDDGPPPKKYTHIVYPAHYDDVCEEHHGRQDPAWPDGCLLDPIRLSWRHLAQEKAKDATKFDLIFQQDDSHSDDELMVQRSWIYDDPGAFDRDRSIWNLYPGTPAGYAVVTIDPSPTKWWAVEAWYYVPGGDDGLGGFRYLLDVEHKRMEGSDLLDYNYATGEWYGVLEEFRRNYLTLGRRLQHIVIEINSGNRWLLQFEQARRWRAAFGIEIHNHTTTINKQDATLGIESLVAPQWKFGRVRLPAATQLDRARVQRFVDEILSYPDVPDDSVLAHWFLEVMLPRIHIPIRESEQRPFRPSWLLSGTLSR